MEVIEVIAQCTHPIYDTPIQTQTGCSNKTAVTIIITIIVTVETSQSIFFFILLLRNKIQHLPGLPRKTEEYKTRLDGSLARESGGDDHSLRHHRPERSTEKKIKILLATDKS